MVTFQYDAKVPASWQWQVGVQMALPWASSLDVSYVGNHGFDRLGGLQGGTTMNLNAVDIGAAFLPQNQDPTLAPSATPGANAYPTTLLRAYRGLEQHQPEHDRVLGHVSLDPDVVQAPVPERLLVRRQLHAGPVARRATRVSCSGCSTPPDGTISYRADQAEYEELNKHLPDFQRHVFKGNAVWDMPDLTTSGAGAAKKTVGYIVNDWQISGVLTANSGPRYDVTTATTANGGNRNITGSPDYAARIIYTGDPGSGCSGNQYAQFNGSAVTGPTCSNNSLGLESGRGLLGRLRGQDGRPLPGAHHPPGRQPQRPVPRRCVQRVQRCHHQRAQHDDHLRQPGQPSGAESAVPRGWHAQPGASDAEERRLRRRHGRAEHAQLPGDDSLPVLNHELEGLELETGAAGGANPTRRFLLYQIGGRA